MGTREPLITIIIPIYNAEAFLPRCIESVLEQTYRWFELLLINDGSTDNSARICSNYAQRDSRIRVFNKANGGVSSARNVGLANMHGDWVCFIDSDDWVEKAYLENLYSKLNPSVELVVSCAKAVNHPCPSHFVYPDYNIQDGNLDILFTKYGLYWRTAPWGKLFKAEIIRSESLMFPEGMHIGEDAHFVYNYLIYTKGIVLSSNVDYNYVYDNNGLSLTKRINSIESELLSLNEICHSVDNLIAKKSISDRVALNRIEWLKATYIRRVINSLYYNNSNKERRMDVLNCLDMSLFIKYILSCECTLYSRIQRFLLESKLYCMYDALKVFVRYLKQVLCLFNIRKSLL